MKLLSANVAAHDAKRKRGQHNWPEGWQDDEEEEDGTETVSVFAQLSESFVEIASIISSPQEFVRDIKESTREAMNWMTLVSVLVCVGAVFYALVWQHRHNPYASGMSMEGDWRTAQEQEEFAQRVRSVPEDEDQWKLHHNLLHSRWVVGSGRVTARKLPIISRNFVPRFL